MISLPGWLFIQGAGRERDTLARAAIAYWPQIAHVGEEGRPGELSTDWTKNTSGLVVLAKNSMAYTWLVQQFKLRKTEKRYLALVDGCPPTPTGRIEAAIGRHKHLRQKMAVQYQAGRKAISEYRTLQAFKQHTLLEVKTNYRTNTSNSGASGVFGCACGGRPGLWQKEN